MKHNEIWVSSVKPSKWTEDAINRAKDILDRRSEPVAVTHCYLGKQETFEEGSARCKFAKTRYSAHYESEITTCKIQEAPMALCSEESCPYFHKGDAYIIVRTVRKEERRMNVCRKGVPCEYATINGYCQLTACLKHLRERKEE